MNDNNKPIIILGQEITESYPKLLEWAKANPATLEATLLSMSKHYGKNVDPKVAVGSAMATLEMDLQHEDALTPLPEEEREPIVD